MAGNLDALNKLYQEVIGRDVDTGGFDYWNTQLNQGTSSLDKIKTQLMGTKEYTDRADAVANAGSAGISEAELDKLGSAYKGSTATMTDQHRAAASASVGLGNAVNAGQVATYSDMFNADGSAKSTWKGIDDWNLNKISSLQDEIKTLEDAAASNTVTTDTTTNTNTNTTAASTDNSFDQFMKFMTALNGIGGMFGGSSVPGFASGGVAAASPYNNFMGFMNAFKSLSGDSTQGITTGNLN